mgnify:CR=1 FL=1
MTTLMVVCEGNMVFKIDPDTKEALDSSFYDPYWMYNMDIDTTYIAVEKWESM